MSTDGGSIFGSRQGARCSSVSLYLPYCDFQKTAKRDRKRRNAASIAIRTWLRSNDKSKARAEEREKNIGWIGRKLSSRGYPTRPKDIQPRDLETSRTTLLTPTPIICRPVMLLLRSTLSSITCTFIDGVSTGAVTGCEAYRSIFWEAFVVNRKMELG